MAKDPAFLFYPGDWQGGTMLLTRHQKGCYMDLLIAQFNNGPLSLESIKTILGQDQAIWTVLSCKFKQNSEGNYSNEKLATEIEKRKNFSKSRRDNVNSRYGKSTYVDTSVEHMNIHMENANENLNGLRKGSAEGKPGLHIVDASYPIEQCTVIALNDERWVKANKTNQVELQEFNAMLERKGRYDQNPKEYKEYFANWKAKGKIEDSSPGIKKMVL